MNAATAEDETGAQRETGAPAPALVLMRTQKEQRATGSPSRAGDASRSHARPVRLRLFTAAGHYITIGLWRARSRHDGVLEDQLTGRAVTCARPLRS
jgi:hypothetical protein